MGIIRNEITNMTLTEARDLIAKALSRSDMETEFDKAVWMLLNCTDEKINNRWIPVSEGLPKNIKPVQVTWRNNEPVAYYQDIKGKHFTDTAHYKDGKWYWYSDVTEDLLAEYGRCDIYEFDSAIEVVAWMPLPKPYGLESENEE